ncbi:hypothetical protein BSLG_002918 [Batrachochytrium salamandrivorans]|nr:hypothetical protein BSLG_002918 [Batrachochytrium salamandrivorans]
MCQSIRKQRVFPTQNTVTAPIEIKYPIISTPTSSILDSPTLPVHPIRVQTVRCTHHPPALTQPCPALTLWTQRQDTRHSRLYPTPHHVLHISKSRKGSLTNLVPSPLYIDPDEIQPARGDHPPRIDTTRFTLANSRDNLNSHQLHRPTSPTVPVRPQGKLRSGDPHRHRNYPAESLRGALSSPGSSQPISPHSIGDLSLSEPLSRQGKF